MHLKFVFQVKTIKAAILGLDMKILKIPAQGKFVSPVCHAHTPTNRPKLWLLQF